MKQSRGTRRTWAPAMPGWGSPFGCPSTGGKSLYAVVRGRVAHLCSRSGPTLRYYRSSYGISLRHEHPPGCVASGRNHRHDVPKHLGGRTEPRGGPPGLSKSLCTPRGGVVLAPVRGAPP